MLQNINSEICVVLFYISNIKFLLPDTLSEIPMPKGASCPQSIIRPSLLFYLTPIFIAFLILNKNITSDIRHMYGN
ncbi:hypothetical protein B9Z55_019282 [Caenorhabditis nigoni]|uniref:Uncharacterized protein n=1 Tax=Caenorhabditis nigoni TaxID=1611254 RepID=A0A2G5THP0_9PELO|nr:hypothetical protein B9Z55_019282 [Caenorhabditis nigoni]